ncbi:MAG: histidine triad nucleotide-binding protein [Proteobacteria bacterium]|nr:histidine triad nucleotide-binding protein [Pseudomonadota bacterium]
MDCLFCQIIEGKIPSDLLYQDDQIVIFSDINPQAPIHKLIVPRKHIATMNDATAEDAALIGHMVLSAQKLAKQLSIAEEGYRLVWNTNKGAGQAVFHIHLHLLGGRVLHWPPG